MKACLGCSDPTNEGQLTGGFCGACIALNKTVSDPIPEDPPLIEHALILVGITFLIIGVVFGLNLLPEKPPIGYELTPQSYLPFTMIIFSSIAQCAFFVALSAGLAHLRVIARNTPKND